MDATMTEQIIEILNNICGADPGEIQADTMLFDEGLLDSFGVVELIVALEDAFSVSLDPAELERSEMANPAAIAATVQAHRA